MPKLLNMVVLCLLLTGGSRAVTSVSQYGITWTFNDDHTAGQFVNGDWWVVGPVTITGITPDFDGTHNGWEVNPAGHVYQGFDTRAPSFDSSLVPVLPYTASAGQSIVKGISVTPLDEGCRPCLRTAAVLTVLAGIPADSGATVFRPPYSGTDKPSYAVDDLHTDLLPSYAPVAATPTLPVTAEKFQRLQLDHLVSGSTGRYIHPEENSPNYGPNIAIRNGEGALRLMLDDPMDDKTPLLVNYVQYGIDLYGMLLNGMSWPQSGHGAGRGLVLCVTAALFDDQAMKDTVNSHSLTNFGENETVWISNGQALFGDPTITEEKYWATVYDPSVGKKTERDPYGYIDGGSAQQTYQICCITQPIKCQACPLQLMPRLKEMWNNPALLDYIDRWVDFGTWSQPDPCAPCDGDWDNYGITYGPDGNGGCIKDTDPSDGIGRFPDLHGTNKDAGGYRSAFVDAMWTAYRNDPTGLQGEQKPFTVVPPRSGFAPLTDPAAGSVTFDLTRFTDTEDFSLRIYGNDGRRIADYVRVPVSGLLVWHTEAVPTGIYVYELRIAGTEHAGTLLKL